MHYYCLVILPKDYDVDSDVEPYVEDVMRPYDEQLAVDPYDEECWDCGGLEPHVKTCETCEGTGTVVSNSNPEGHWDWYVIGGRWHGVLGTGVEPLGDDEEYYRHHLDGNLARCASIVLDDDKIPNTIVTPDGVWHACEGPGDHAWHEHARGLLWVHAEHYCVVVDYHN